MNMAGSNRVDHFCNYGVKKPCSARVYGFQNEGEYSVAVIQQSIITSKFCAGECEAGIR